MEQSKEAFEGLELYGQENAIKMHEFIREHVLKNFSDLNDPVIQDILTADIMDEVLKAYREGYIRGKSGKTNP